METKFNLMDMHVHSIWSDGDNTIKELVEDAMSKNIKILGITDHFNIDTSYAVTTNEVQLYIQEINKYKRQYKDKITILVGLEIDINLLNNKLKDVNFIGLDYILIENLDYVLKDTGLEDLERDLTCFSCRTGLAHTDLFKLAKVYKDKGFIDYVIDFMRRNAIFYEINSDFSYGFYDHIIYQETQLSRNFIEKLINNNIEVTVGTDRHSIDDMEMGRFIQANEVANYINSREDKNNNLI